MQREKAMDDSRMVLKNYIRNLTKCVEKKPDHLRKEMEIGNINI